MNLKKLTILTASIFILSSIPCFSQDFAFVDMQKIVNNYDKAKDLVAEYKISEAEMQKLISEAQKQLKEAKTTESKKQIEDKYTAQLQEKQKAYKEAYMAKWVTINDSINTAIKKTAKEKNIDVVLAKGSIICGGQDLTDSVISSLKK